MLQLHGRVERVSKNPRPDGTGGTFDAVTIVVQGWGATFYVEPNRDFGDIPEPGTEAVIEVAPRPYVRKDGSAGVGWRGVRNVTGEVSAGAGVRAAS